MTAKPIVTDQIQISKSSSYLRCGPRLVLWTAIHCNGFMHVLVHLKEMMRER